MSPQKTPVADGTLYDFSANHPFVDSILWFTYIEFRFWDGGLNENKLKKLLDNLLIFG